MSNTRKANNKRLREIEAWRTKQKLRVQNDFDYKQQLGQYRVDQWWQNPENPNYDYYRSKRGQTSPNLVANSDLNTIYRSPDQLARNPELSPAFPTSRTLDPRLDDPTDIAETFKTEEIEEMRKNPQKWLEDNAKEAGVWEGLRDRGLSAMASLFNYEDDADLELLGLDLGGIESVWDGVWKRLAGGYNLLSIGFGGLLSAAPGGVRTLSYDELSAGYSPWEIFNEGAIGLKEDAAPSPMQIAITSVGIEAARIRRGEGRLADLALLNPATLPFVAAAYLAPDSPLQDKDFDIMDDESRVEAFASGPEKFFSGFGDAALMFADPLIGAGVVAKVGKAGALGTTFSKAGKKKAANAFDQQTFEIIKEVDEGVAAQAQTAKQAGDNRPLLEIVFDSLTDQVDGKNDLTRVVALLEKTAKLDPSTNSIAPIMRLAQQLTARKADGSKQVTAREISRRREFENNPNADILADMLEQANDPITASLIIRASAGDATATRLLRNFVNPAMGDALKLRQKEALVLAVASGSEDVPIVRNWLEQTKQNIANDKKLLEKQKKDAEERKPQRVTQDTEVDPDVMDNLETAIIKDLDDQLEILEELDQIILGGEKDALARRELMDLQDQEPVMAVKIAEAALQQADATGKILSDELAALRLGYKDFYVPYKDNPVSRTVMASRERSARAKYQYTKEGTSILPKRQVRTDPKTGEGLRDGMGQLVYEPRRIFNQNEWFSSSSIDGVSRFRRNVRIWRWAGEANPVGYLGLKGTSTVGMEREVDAMLRSIDAYKGTPERVQRGSELRNNLIKAIKQGQVDGYEAVRMFERAVAEDIIRYYGLADELVRADQDVATVAQAVIKKAQRQRDEIFQRLNSKDPDTKWWADPEGGIDYSPFLEAQAANGTMVINFDELQKVMKQVGTDTSLQSKWRQSMTIGADLGVETFNKLYGTFNNLWRPATLLRASYTQRNVFEGSIRAMAYTHSLRPLLWPAQAAFDGVYNLMGVNKARSARAVAKARARLDDAGGKDDAVAKGRSAENVEARRQEQQLVVALQQEPSLAPQNVRIAVYGSRSLVPDAVPAGAPGGAYPPGTRVDAVSVSGVPILRPSDELGMSPEIREYSPADQNQVDYLNGEPQPVSIKSLQTRITTLRNNNPDATDDEIVELLLAGDDPVAELARQMYQADFDDVPLETLDEADTGLGGTVDDYEAEADEFMRLSPDDEDAFETGADGPQRFNVVDLADEVPEETQQSVVREQVNRLRGTSYQRFLREIRENNARGGGARDDGRGNLVRDNKGNIIVDRRDPANLERKGSEPRPASVGGRTSNDPLDLEAFNLGEQEIGVRATREEVDAWEAAYEAELRANPEAMEHIGWFGSPGINISGPPAQVRVIRKIAGEQDQQTQALALSKLPEDFEPFTFPDDTPGEIVVNPNAESRSVTKLPPPGTQILPGDRVDVGVLIYMQLKRAYDANSQAATRTILVGNETDGTNGLVTAVARSIGFDVKRFDVIDNDGLQTAKDLVQRRLHQQALLDYELNPTKDGPPELSEFDYVQRYNTPLLPEDKVSIGWGEANDGSFGYLDADRNIIPELQPSIKGNENPELRRLIFQELYRIRDKRMRTGNNRPHQVIAFQGRGKSGGWSGGVNSAVTGAVLVEPSSSRSRRVTDFFEDTDKYDQDGPIPTQRFQIETGDRAQADAVIYTDFPAQEYGIGAPDRLKPPETPSEPVPDVLPAPATASKKPRRVSEDDPTTRRPTLAEAVELINAREDAKKARGERHIFSPEKRLEEAKLLISRYGRGKGGKGKGAVPSAAHALRDLVDEQGNPLLDKQGNVIQGVSDDGLAIDLLGGDSPRTPSVLGGYPDPEQSMYAGVTAARSAKAGRNRQELPQTPQGIDDITGDWRPRPSTAYPNEGFVATYPVATLDDGIPVQRFVTEAEAQAELVRLRQIMNDTNEVTDAYIDARLEQVSGTRFGKWWKANIIGARRQVEALSSDRALAQLFADEPGGRAYLLRSTLEEREAYERLLKLMYDEEYALGMFGDMAARKRRIGSGSSRNADGSFYGDAWSGPFTDMNRELASADMTTKQRLSLRFNTSESLFLRSIKGSVQPRQWDLNKPRATYDIAHGIARNLQTYASSELIQRMFMSLKDDGTFDLDEVFAWVTETEAGQKWYMSTRQMLGTDDEAAEATAQWQKWEAGGRKGRPPKLTEVEGGLSQFGRVTGFDPNQPVGALVDTGTNLFWSPPVVRAYLEEIANRMEYASWDIPQIKQLFLAETLRRSEGSLPQLTGAGRLGDLTPLAVMTRDIEKVLTDLPQSVKMYLARGPKDEMTVPKEFLDINPSLAGKDAQHYWVLADETLRSSTRKVQDIYSRMIGGLFNLIGTMPEDAFVRMPFYNRQFKLTRDDLIRDYWDNEFIPTDKELKAMGISRSQFEGAQQLGEKNAAAKMVARSIGQDGEIRIPLKKLRAIEVASHRQSLADTRQWLYTIERRTNLGKYGEYAFPFISATQNSVTVIGKLLQRDPWLGPLAIDVWRFPQKLGIEDDEGNILIPIPKKVKENSVFKDVLGIDENSVVKFNKGGLNTLSPETGYGMVPRMGPLQIIPASEAMKAGFLPVTTPKIVKTLLGDEEGDQFYGEFKKYLFGEEGSYSEEYLSWDKILPGWVQKGKNARDTLSAAYGYKYNTVYIREMNNFYTGQRDTAPSGDELNEIVLDQFLFDVIGAQGLPTPATPYPILTPPKIGTPEEALQELVRAYFDQSDRSNPDSNPGGDFQEKFGYLMASGARATTSTGMGGIAPQLVAVEDAKRFAPLIDDVADNISKDNYGVLGMLTNMRATRNDYDRNARTWQKLNHIPGKGIKWREDLAPDEQIQEAQRVTGWVNYRARVDALEGQLFDRGLRNFQQRGAEDLKFKKEALIEDMTANPLFSGWTLDYEDAGRGKTVAANQTLRLALADDDFKQFMFNEGMENTWKCMSVYVSTRNRVGNFVNSIEGGIDKPENRNVKIYWEGFQEELRMADDRWAEMFDLYLSSDTDPAVQTNLRRVINQERLEAPVG
jgi:hypothetical protein